jgi:hypothetical protein
MYRRDMYKFQSSFERCLKDKAHIDCLRNLEDLSHPNLEIHNSLLHKELRYKNSTHTYILPLGPLSFLWKPRIIYDIGWVIYDCDVNSMEEIEHIKETVRRCCNKNNEQDVKICLNWFRVTEKCRRIHGGREKYIIDIYRNEGIRSLFYNARFVITNAKLYKS